MAYIGKSIESGTFSVLDTSGNTYNGSNTAFNLGTQVGSVAQLLVSHDGVIQKPGTDYTLSSGGAAITFTTAPASGASIFIVEISGAVGGPLDSDLNGTELILDADGDTSITADTDDQIDIKIAGDDDFTFTASTLTVNSTNKICFNDASQSIQGASATVLDINATDEIELNATAIDLNGTLDVSGTSLLTGRVGVVTAGDLGTGIHVRTADSGAGVDAGADELVLENSGNAGLSIASGNTSTGTIIFSDNGGSAEGFVQYKHDDNYLRFGTGGGNERMRIFGDGDVSIGATSTSGRLHVADSNASQDLILFNATSGSFTQNVMKVQCSRDTSNATFGIMHARNGGGHVFNIDDGGNVKNASNSYGSISDERIKQDIADASSQWNDIKALKIKKYKLKKLVNRDGADNTPYYLGVVAQELEASGMNGLVEENNPEKEDVALHSDFGTVVDGTADNGATPIKDADGNITGYEDVFTAGKNKKEVKYSILYMKAIKALQEAMAKIETLETKVKALEDA